MHSFSLQDGHNFHFYVNILPKGDARVIASVGKSDSTEEKVLRYYSNSGSSVPCHSGQAPQWSELSGEEAKCMPIMCASDKMLRWNFIGAIWLSIRFLIIISLQAIKARFFRITLSQCT